LNLLIVEVAYAISNPNKTIIQMEMQQPIIDLYLAESSSMHRGESSISEWYPSLMGVLMGLNFLPKRPSNLGPSALSIFFTLETKGMGGGIVLAYRRRQSSRGLSRLRLLNRHVITMPNVDRTIAIYCC
jgi:hypothetical protein